MKQGVALGALILALGTTVAAGGALRIPPVPSRCPADAIVVSGSGACVRLGGSVGATLSLGRRGQAGLLTMGGSVGARVVADVMVPTEAGPVRGVAVLRYGRALPRR